MKTTQGLCFLLLSAMIGCNDIDYEHSAMDSFSAYPIIGDQSIQIDLSKTPKFVCGTVDGPPTEYYAPDQCELYVSDNPDGPFEKIYTAVQLNNDGDTYTLKAINGKPYYIYTLSHKKGFPAIQTPTIMVVPNPQPVQHTITSVAQQDYTYGQHISYNPVKDKIVYYNPNYEDSSSILLTDLNGSSTEQIVTNGTNPSWDRTGEKIFFKNKEGLLHLYDCKTKEIIPFPTDNPLKCGKEVLISPNNDRLLYQDASLKNIHIFNLLSKEDTVILNLNKNYAPSSFCWINENEYLFSGGQQGGQQHDNINKASISGKSIISTMTSGWNDYAPSLSPDKQKLAFISDRSGSLQVWIYDYVSQSYRQITGYQKKVFTYPITIQSNIEWIDNTTICFIFDSQIIRINL